jgi:anti-sigma factor RsiW
VTVERGWGLSDQHLLPDVVVAFVDGELSATAYDRASSHLARCQPCAAEIVAQRQARKAVQSADAPAMPAGLLATLRAIPDQVETPGTPDGLAMTADGQLVAVQRPDRVGPLRSGQPLGSSTPLGSGRSVLGRRPSRRTAQGAGVVVSGIVLGALALVNAGSDDPAPTPADHQRPAVSGGGVQAVMSDR